jgi:hypothetical protein
MSKALKRHSQASTKVELRRILDGDDIYADAVTLVLSYAFIFLGALNDRLLGIEPSPLTVALEWLLATGLAIEIALRLRFTRKRPWYFYPLVLVDVAAVATIIPGLKFIQFARTLRILVSGGRMLQLIDAISRRRGNPYLVLLIYPFIVPPVSALFYFVERHANNANVHDYFHALILMLSYSLTVGFAANHPVTYSGKLLAGVMFLTGLMCVSIIGNALTSRYTEQRHSERRAHRENDLDGRLDQRKDAVESLTSSTIVR